MQIGLKTLQNTSIPHWQHSWKMLSSASSSPQRKPAHRESQSVRVLSLRSTGQRNLPAFGGIGLELKGSRECATAKFSILTRKRNTLSHFRKSNLHRLQLCFERRYMVWGVCFLGSLYKFRKNPSTCVPAELRWIVSVLRNMKS
jgi:hypothetical protein